MVAVSGAIETCKAAFDGGGEAGAGGLGGAGGGDFVGAGGSVGFGAVGDGGGEPAAEEGAWCVFWLGLVLLFVCFVEVEEMCIGWEGGVLLMGWRREGG